ncbi:MAG: DUF1080 domain-containing protein, partial [Cyclobacteriaceae bacterium]|nr:DUF1080 domain-containing protein [Cyclobacteriaceae bacterium]
MLLVLFINLSFDQEGESAGGQQKVKSETVRLFNGKDLEGWYTYLKGRGKYKDPKKVFSVEDGILRISGKEWGCITTEKEYENYHLVVEFKWGDETFKPRVDNARDCGVLLHSNGEDGAYNGTWMHSIECQIIEGGTGDFIVVGDGSEKLSLTAPVAAEKQGSSPVFKLAGERTTLHKGRVNWHGRDAGWKDVKGFRGARDVENPVGEWNRLECIVKGDQITVFLNGILVNKAFDVRPSKGRIQIQSEGAEIFFRRVDLIPLPENYRLIYNSDANNMIIYDESPMTREELNKYIDEVAERGVTSFFMSPNFGMPVIYPTEVGDMIGEHVSPELAVTLTPETRPKSTERGIMNIRALTRPGQDALSVVLDRAHELGMESFVTFRINEVHGVDKEDALILSRFWKEHPEWHIGKNGDPLDQVYLDILGPRTHPIVAGWLPGGLNFAVPEVRAHKLAQLRELCERYDMEGLEIDFQRFPIFFKPGEEQKHLDTMTGWMREVRNMVSEVSRERNRTILLCARILARPEQNTAIGLDPVTWAKEGLLDFVTISHYLHNNFPLPVKEYRNLFPDNFPVYASIEVEKETDSYREIAGKLWEEGTNGIMLFNFFTRRESGIQPYFDIIPEIGTPVAKDDMVATSSFRNPMGSALLVANKHDNELCFIDPNTLFVRDRISTGPNPHEMVVTPDQRFAYLSNYKAPGNTISVIDLVQRRHIRQISTGDITRIHG